MSSSPPPLPPPGGELPGPAPPPAPPLAAALSPVPWEERSRLGFGPALVGTAELFVMRPGEGFARARRTGDVLSPVLWVALVALAGALVQLFWSLLISVPLQGLIDGVDARFARIC